jgi:NADPH:quinone reductase-like Zn-dependent oxidoreductase
VLDQSGKMLASLDCYKKVPMEFTGHNQQLAASPTMKASTVPTKPKNLVFRKELLEAGKAKPVIDRRYTLSEVAEALRYLEEGHAQGKVVITV